MMMGDKRLSVLPVVARYVPGPMCSACRSLVDVDRAELELAHMRARLLGLVAAITIARLYRPAFTNVGLCVPRSPAALGLEVATTTRGVWPPRGRR